LLVARFRVSAGAVFQEALRVVNRLALTPEAQRDVLAAMERGRPSLPMLYGLGHDAGLAYESLMGRAAGIFLGFCACNLADDLADGDCTYLSPPDRIGPGLQYLLQNAFVTALADVGIPSSVLGAATRDLVEAAAQQQCEVRTSSWNAATYRRIGQGIAGRQWVAYLRVLWHATPLEEEAGPLGLVLGELGHIAEDVRSRDPRIFGMTPGDQRAILDWARAALPSLRTHALPAVDAMLRSIEPILQNAR
jgi:hypothetical protein